MSWRGTVDRQVRTIVVGFVLSILNAMESVARGGVFLLELWELEPPVREQRQPEVRRPRGSSSQSMC
jgi:hypothetical protein